MYEPPICKVPKLHPYRWRIALLLETKILEGFREERLSIDANIEEIWPDPTGGGRAIPSINYS